MKYFLIFVLVAAALPGAIVAVIKVPAFGIIGLIAGLQYALVIAGVHWILKKILQTNSRTVQSWLYRGALIVEIVGLGFYVFLHFYRGN